MRLSQIMSVLAASVVLTLPATAQQPAKPVPAAVATYRIDPVHSELSFRIRHLVGRVTGTFTEWGGELQADPATLAGGSVKVTVQTKSIHTLNVDRDAHLRTPDFFAADSFPVMTFSSRRVEMVGNNVEVFGDLTLRGRTHPVVLRGIYRGRVIKDPWGAERIAFEATTTINRQDFGVSFNQLIEEMSVIGDDVDLAIAIEAVRQ